MKQNCQSYAEAELPGSLDHLIDELRDRLHKPFPGADLLRRMSTST